MFKFTRVEITMFKFTMKFTRVRMKMFKYAIFALT